MRRILVVVVLVVGLLVATAPVAGASFWGPGSRTTAPARSSHAAINNLLRVVLPPLCPVLGKLAVPQDQVLVQTQCQNIATSTDPLASLSQFVQLGCSGNPPVLTTVLRPELAPLIKIGCPILTKVLQLVT